MFIPIQAPAAAEGSTVAIVATSSPVSDSELDRLTGYFKSRGYHCREYPSTRAATGYLAGAALQRSADLMDAFLDPDVRLIVPATGGKGAAQLLSLLDYDAIAAHPTILTGMSDPSILLNAISARTRLLTLHGPSGFDFFQTDVNQVTVDGFFAAITTPIGGMEVSRDDWRVLRSTGAAVTGRVYGGHLGTNRALIGTPYAPDVDGAILILEEAFVSWADIDAALTHLRLAGIFGRIAALVVGAPVATEQGDSPDKTWDDLILRNVDADIPIVANVAFGHTPEKICLPIGGLVELGTAYGRGVLRFLEDFVRQS
jgi:muramoyltetrapeptide carboxypeptidase